MIGRDAGRSAPGTSGSGTRDAGLAPGKRTLVEALDAGVAPRPALLVDGEASAPEQLSLAAFLDELHGEVIAAANAELAPASADACPYIEQYFARYRQSTAADALALITRFAPGTRGARTARELIPPLLARIRPRATSRSAAKLDAPRPPPMDRRRRR